MSKNSVLAAALIVLIGAVPAFAQDVRPELSITVGWTFSDGVSGDPVLAGGQFYDRVDPKDSFNWGLGFGFPVNENVELGFLFGQQPSTLLAGGTTEKEIGDFTTNTYHGYFGYNFGPGDAKVRPYFLFGLGATSYGGVDFTRANGQAGSIASFTQFSTTWGAGVKGYGSGHVGYRAGASWTPTYIKSDSVGWWCDPYWGCYVVGDPQYANQFSLNGGVLFKF
jgi:hypothetical protein